MSWEPPRIVGLERSGEGRALRWTLALETGEVDRDPVTVRLTTSALFSYKRVSLAVLEKAGVILAPMRQWDWRLLLSRTHRELKERGR